MRRTILVAATLSCIFAGRAEAQWTDGNALSESCEYWSRTIESHSVNAHKGGYCGGYVTGVADALDGSHFCVPGGPSGVQQGQMVDVVKLYLRDHPETRNRGAANLIVAALKEKFPCN